MPFHLGATELLLIIVVIILIFGAGKLPQIGGAIGKGIREFRRGISGKQTSKAAKPEA